MRSGSPPGEPTQPSVSPASDRSAAAAPPVLQEGAGPPPEGAGPYRGWTGLHQDGVELLLEWEESHPEGAGHWSSQRKRRAVRAPDWPVKLQVPHSHTAGCLAPPLVS